MNMQNKSKFSGIGVLVVFMLTFAFLTNAFAWADTQTRTLNYRVTNGVVTFNASTMTNYVVPLNVSNVARIASYVVEGSVLEGVVPAGLNIRINGTLCTGSPYDTHLGLQSWDCTSQMSTSIAGGHVNLSVENTNASVYLNASLRQILTVDTTETTTDLSSVTNRLDSISAVDNSTGGAVNTTRTNFAGNATNWNNNWTQVSGNNTNHTATLQQIYAEDRNQTASIQVVYDDLLNSLANRFWTFTTRTMTKFGQNIVVWRQ